MMFIWSWWSVSLFYTFQKEKSNYRCLQKLFDGPACAEDELCVCLCIQECEEDPCCEYETCKLKSGAQCGYGECCYNCQVYQLLWRITNDTSLGMSVKIIRSLWYLLSTYQEERCVAPVKMSVIFQSTATAPHPSVRATSSSRWDLGHETWTASSGVGGHSDSRVPFCVPERSAVQRPAGLLLQREVSAPWWTVSGPVWIQYVPLAFIQVQLFRRPSFNHLLPFLLVFRGKGGSWNLLQRRQQQRGSLR